MSLYGDYIKEHRGDEIVECDEGFATYRFLNDGKTVYIVDIYVRPEYRKNDIASILADSIVQDCKAKGCKELLGSVVPSANNSTDSAKVMLAYGMKLQSSTDNMIIFKKDI